MKRYQTTMKGNTLESRIRATVKSETPYIIWLENLSAYRVKLDAPSEGYKALNKRFYVAKFGSRSKTLAAAIEYRDANLDPIRREYVQRREPPKVEDDAKMPSVPKDKRFKPTLCSQFQLWHKPRNQQTDMP